MTMIVAWSVRSVQAGGVLGASCSTLPKCHCIGERILAFYAFVLHMVSHCILAVLW